MRRNTSLTKLTPARYLQTIRLKAARRMLSDDEGKSVTEVAFDCGFSSSQHFATCFRKQFGVSPTDLRLGASSGGLEAR